MKTSIKKQKWMRQVLASGRYSADAFGNVYSHYNQQQNKRSIPLLLSQATDKKGYKRVVVRDASKSSSCLVHHLVWLTVHEPLEGDQQLNHIDGDKTNNRLSNLELVTCKQNIRHAIKIGLREAMCAPTYRFTKDQIADMRRLYAAGTKQTQLAKMFATSQGYISNIIKGRVW